VPTPHGFTQEQGVRLMKTVSDFFLSKTAPGILLCLSAILALIIVNSPLKEYYDLFKKNTGHFSGRGFYHR
jgi:Na+/H+ antiporter NhaA